MAESVAAFSGSGRGRSTDQVAEILPVERQQRLRQRKRSEQNRAILARRKYHGAVERDDVIDDYELTPKANPVRSGRAGKLREVSQDFADRMGAAQQRLDRVRRKVQLNSR